MRITREGNIKKKKKRYTYARVKNEGKNIMSAEVTRNKDMIMEWNSQFQMGCCKKNGVCDLEILKHLSPNTNFENINWCEYVLESLLRCKEGWKKHLKNNSFCGPVTLLTVIFFTNFNL